MNAESAGRELTCGRLRTGAEKMRIRPGSRSHLRAAPSAAVVAAIGLPALDLRSELDGEFDYLHLFTTSQADLDHWFPILARHLAPSGALWVSWPKAHQLGADLRLPVVVRIGYSHGLVESTCLSMDNTWSALKFTHPKPGKTYRNSHSALRGAPEGR